MDARPIFLGHLADVIASLDKQMHHTILCASGIRATVGTALLLRAGFKNVDVFLFNGSMDKKTR